VCIVATCCSFCDDCRRQGLPIVILGGPGEGESGVITEYHGRTRRANVEFESNVGYGSKYAIRHDEGLGMGYKVRDESVLQHVTRSCVDTFMASVKLFPVANTALGIVMF
jgi:hypothetical protein